MMEYAPPVKRDEQYPLLKVETGGGDNVNRAQVPSTITPPAWHVACTPKQSWCSRWPEFVSACWMTAILLAISFLVFCALGMSAYRRQPVVILKCNDSKPASDVFYHHVVSRDSYIPFALFSRYLSFMAKKYPLLRFNVYFLIDDSWQSSVQASRHLRLIKRLVPQITGPFKTIFDHNYKREINDFQRRYQNVNISVMHLSKYMAKTPLKYTWRTIPSNCLSFYARVYAIWQNGGVGFDLITFNNQFNKNQAIDRRVDALLKQHNDGIEPDKYAETIKKFDNEERSELFSMFFNFINQILNDTCSFFSADLSPDIKIIDNSPVMRTHRSKRDIKLSERNNTKDFVKIVNQTTNSNANTSNNISQSITNMYKMNSSNEFNKTNLWNSHGLLRQYEFLDIFKIPNISNINFEIPQILFFYDIGFSDDMGPPYLLSKGHPQSDLSSKISPIAKYATKNGESKLKYLSLTPEGHFIAASARLHPFLAQLFFDGSQRLNPKYAIKDTLLSQCSGFLRDDIYCENIRVVYNVV